MALRGLDADVDESFALEIDLTERERSLDSQTNTFGISVDGSAVRYHGPYGEGTRGVYRSESVSFELSADQRADLRREVDSYDLAQSVDRICWQCKEYAEEAGAWWKPVQLVTAAGTSGGVV